MTIDPAVVIAAVTASIAAVSRAVWIVYGDLRRDRDEWRDMALALRDVNKQAIEVTEKATRRG